MKTLLITGGTGLVGKRLSEMACDKGYHVIHLSRHADPHAEFPAYQWDIPSQYIDQEAIDKADYIVHLAGAGVADKPWTPGRKEEILSSRVDGLALVAKYLEKAGKKPSAFLSASATGFYGNAGEAVCTESSPAAGPGDFLSEVCQKWEAATGPIQAMGIRTCIVRVGIVLSKKGAALAEMLPSYKFRIGAYFGDGQQWYPWIHLDDLCRMMLFLLETPSAQGIYNGVAPNPVRNKELAKAIGDAMGKTCLIVPAPAFVMRTVMGERAAIVLTGCRASSEKIEKEGFVFECKVVGEALKREV